MKTGAIRPIEQNDYLIKELKKQKEKQQEKEQKGYTFIIDGMKLPVTPEKLTVKIGNNNKTYTLMNDGEINILKTPGLTEIEFEALLPNVEYSFAEYENGFKNAKAYLNKLEKLKKKKKKFQFMVSRALPNGNHLFDTNMKCSLEEYTITEDASNTGMDVLVSVSLKQYRKYGVKKCKVKKKKQVNIQKLRESKEIHIENEDGEAVILLNGCYVIKLKKAMTVYNLAKKVYGHGDLYKVIAKANAKPASLRGEKPVLWKKSKKLKKGQKVNIPDTYYR